jgi:multidrug efflux pump subunit AcrA (membrane-fusion protein)
MRRHRVMLRILSALKGSRPLWCVPHPGLLFPKKRGRGEGMPNRWVRRSLLAEGGFRETRIIAGCVAWDLLLVFLASCSHETRKAEKAATPVRVIAVENFTPRTGERYSASIEPTRQVNLAFRVSGFVQYLHQIRSADGRMRSLEPGDMVTAGTVLARLRQEDYDIQLRQAQGQQTAARENEKAAVAQLGQAQAANVKADADFARAKALIESQSLTQPDFDSAKAQYDSARLQLEASRAQLDAAVAQLQAADAALASARLAQQDTSMVAPFSAAVVQRNIELGTLAGPSTTAYSLADLNSVKASFGVPDVVAVRLKRGTSLSIFAEALPEREFRGMITSVAAVADRNTRLFQVDLTLSNPQAVLKPGMIATLSLGSPAKVEHMPVVPLSAVVRAHEGASGFAVVVVDGNQARRREVTLGNTYGDRIAVVRGVRLGERVVASGAALIAEGDNVEVIP